MPTIADAGLFGGPADLPSGGGPIDPPILTGNYPYTPSGPPVPLYPPDPSGAGFVNSSLGNSAAGGDYTPSDIMQAYLDFYRNDPQAAGATAPPVPGQQSGGGNSSVFSRIINNIPAVRLARAIGNMIPRESWQHNAQPRTGAMQGPPALPPGGALFGYNPSQGGGTPRYDPGTGRTTPTPSLNPLFTTGGAFQPVANAPADVRWAPNSGTGNFQATRTTQSFIEHGGYAGPPNRPGPDETNRFTPQAGLRTYIDPENGGIARRPLTPAEVAAFDPTRAAAASDLYQQALRAVPHIQGEGANYTARVNAWIRQQQAAANPGAGLPPLRISGPPIT